MFYENLLKLCSENSTTPTTMAKSLHFSSSAPTNWKNGAVPRDSTLQKIADYFGVTTDELLADTGNPAKVTHLKGEKIGVLSYVAAGIPLNNIDIFDPDDPASWEEITSDMAKNGEYFALRIKGDSMLPRIRHGDLVIVRKQPTVEEGETAVVLVNGDEGTCKRVHYRDDGIQLLSNNEDYPPRFFSKQQIKELPVQIVGLVVEIRGKP